MKIFMSFVLTMLMSLGLAVAVAWAAAGTSSGARQNKDVVKAAALVDQGKFLEAIPLLKKVVTSEPKNADAYSYLGYSHRKLGATDLALGYYRKALDLKPKHLGANEYLGELYLELGDLKGAEERLEILDWACLFGCEEYTDLKRAIEAYKAKTGG